ncbi:MAG: class I SAM-dependent methyltransferase [Bryobacteraceae bacterium]
MDTLKQRQQQTWATGDFSKIGVEIMIVGERLCDFVPLYAGDRVLDVATGSGNTALAAARRGCVVTGLDFVEALLERGRERAAAERVAINFQLGDAEELPFPDASFDVVLTTFGAMFAPDAVKTASELARVCRPGGKIGMANWTPEGLPGQMFKLNAKYLAPPPGIEPPVLWGIEDKVRQRFGALATDLKSEKHLALFRALSATHWVEFMKAWFGPTIRTFAAISLEDQAKLQMDLVDLVSQANRADNGTLLCEAEYLQVVVSRA